MPVVAAAEQLARFGAADVFFSEAIHLSTYSISIISARSAPSRPFFARKVLRRAPIDYTRSGATFLLEQVERIVRLSSVSETKMFY